MSSNIEEKLAVNKFDLDRDVHIRVNVDLCGDCIHPCVYACPANCYKFSDNHITFSFEGCLECGSCRIVCPKGAVEWTLPQPGFGVCFEYG